MEYPEKNFEKFKQDYYNHGKFNLEIQVTHLYRLAEFYHEKYKVTKDWTDCIKAHALYNSVGARRPEYLDWNERVFEIQQQYWGGKSTLSFDQQQTLTANLKHELESIRDRSRDEMSAADECVEGFVDTDASSEHFTTFYECMRSLSVSCSERMAKFAGRIISESVAMISPYKPPCDFVALAIGSLARGEATPYSDLEYLFLVEDKSQYSLEYFEQLAITSYFLIANLGETKLSYMSIEELKGWFHDCSKNGFKIDGLSKKAGNIPTGNGTPSQHNHFIVTPQELVNRYHTVLDNPVKEEATRGDLTAMLMYRKSIYSHQTAGRDMLRELQDKIQKIIPTVERVGMNVNMLEADIQKFDFHPSFLLDRTGFAADVKADFYRFPSIILYDITVITQTFTQTSWEALDELHNKVVLSSKLYQMLQFLLASASYMRLSAYLYHDSQDDRISVLPSTVRRQKKSADLSKFVVSQRRWFVPSRIFTSICSNTLLIKRSLEQGIQIQMLHNRGSKAMFFFSPQEFVHIDDKWCHAIGLLCSGRDEESLAVVKEMFGDSICERPLSILDSTPSGESLLNTLSVLGIIMLNAEECKAAAEIYQYMFDNGLYDERLQLAGCYIHCGNYDRALDIIESLKDCEQTVREQAQTQLLLASIFFTKKHYDKAEEAYLSALDLEHYHSINDDCEGNHAKTEIPTALHHMSLSNVKTPEKILSKITHISVNLVFCVTKLGDIYFEMEKYLLAEAYFIKARELVCELYGEGAANPVVGSLFERMGRLYSTSKDYDKAINNYGQASIIFREISYGYMSSDYVSSLNGLACCFFETQDYKKAKYHYKQALAVYREQPKVTANGEIECALRGLGHTSAKMGLFGDAKDYFDQALVMYRHSSDERPKIDLATCNLLKDIGQMHLETKLYRKAEEYLKEALFIYTYLAKSSQDDHVPLIASILLYISYTYDHLRRHSEADDYHEQCVYKSISGGAATSLIAAELRTRGRRLMSSGYREKAVEHLSKAKDLIKKIDPGNETEVTLIEKDIRKFWC